MTEKACGSVIHVVAGAVTQLDGRVLIAQRLPGKHLAGGWEFPGGKLDPGEPRAAGLERELREELGIEIRDPRPLMRVRHTYSYGTVLLDMWVVRHYEGEPKGMDGQALRWCRWAELATADLLPADRPIVRALRLPPHLFAATTTSYRVSRVNAARTGSGPVSPAGRLWGVFCADGAAASDAVRRGADFVVLERNLPLSELEALCCALDVPVFARGLTEAAAFQAGASGTHELAV